MKEYILEELLPSNAIEIAKDYNLDFFTKQSGVYYQKGDVIGEIRITKYNKYELVRNFYIDVFQLFAPNTGVYDFTILKKMNYYYMSCKKFVQDKIVICKSYLDFQEMAEDIINKYCNYEIVEDVFNKEKKILWKNWIYLNHYDDFELRFRGPYSKSFPFVRLDNSKEQFVFQYKKKDFSVHKFAKGDSFHFVFENNKHLEYQLRKAAANTNNSSYKQVTFIMLPQDIKLFASENLIGIRCEFQNGDAPLELKKENDLASLTFKFYFQKYIKALLECGVNIDATDYKCESASEVKKEPLKSKEESCFVYLMKDETNGYYKIGISNRPEYRERTLQSEKPTIALLCAKEFPTRIIAEAIESALHKAYEDKRLRGEWFALDEKDVLDIVKTLS